MEVDYKGDPNIPIQKWALAHGYMMYRCVDKYQIAYESKWIGPEHKTFDDAMAWLSKHVNKPKKPKSIPKQYGSW